jgi:alkanesulfonate monooxygenase SsuD/methylene tetrahydromethanopterin reductase-like flavin-dependent oxidoreductase (luciferase family)
MGAQQFFESLSYLWRKYSPATMNIEQLKRVGSTAIAGTPATVRARIEEDLEVSGAGYCALRFAYGNLTHEESVRSLELFTSEVMPHFQE